MIHAVIIVPIDGNRRPWHVISLFGRTVTAHSKGRLGHVGHDVALVQRSFTESSPIQSVVLHSTLKTGLGLSHDFNRYPTFRCLCTSIQLQVCGDIRRKSVRSFAPMTPSIKQHRERCNVLVLSRCNSIRMQWTSDVVSP